MSESAQGPGWWQASDGKWYAPERHPQAGSTLPPPGRQPQAPATPPPPTITPFGSPGGTVKKMWWRRWWVIALGAVGVLVIVAAIAAIAGNNDKDEPAASDPSSPSVADEPVVDVQDTAPSATEPADQPADQPAETAPVEPDVVGTRDNALPIGEPVTITLDAFGDGDGSVWTIVVDGPGTDVTQQVREETPFNEPPPEGSIYFGVPVSLTLDSANKEPLSTLFNLELEFFGAATATIIDQGFDEGCGLAPTAIDPLKEVFVGGTLSGIVCLAVSEADVNAGVLLTTDSGDADRIFFSTTGGAAAAPPAPPGDRPQLPAVDDREGLGSRSNPYAIDEEVTITLDSFGDGNESVWTIVVTGPGTDLTDAVAAENPINEPPPEGSTYFGVPVTLTLNDANKEPLSAAFNLELEFFGPETLSIIDLGLDEGCGVTPNGLDPFKELFAGGSVSGVVCLAVTAADIEAGVLLTTDSGQLERIFFATS